MKLNQEKLNSLMTTDYSNIFEQVLKTLSTTCLFENLGKSFEHSKLNNISYTIVGNIHEAKLNLTSKMYEIKNVIESKNVNLFLHSIKRNLSYEESKSIDEFCIETIKPIVIKRFSELNIDFGEKEWKVIGWTISNIIKIYNFRNEKSCPRYFLEIFEIYLLGHLPCGWTREKGRKLIVY